MSYFLLNSVDSRTKGIILENLPPIGRAPIRHNQIDVPGRDGCEFETLGYGAYTNQFTIGIKDESIINEIVAWLDGTCKIVFSNELDKEYTVTFMDQVLYEKLRRFRKATVSYIAQPFKYATSNNEEVLGKSSTVTNSGTYYCEPTITLIGTGNAEIKVNNDIVCTITNVDGSITIDSNKHDCYKGDTLCNRKMTGEFPTFIPGNNSLVVTGDGITSVKVVKNERWL